MKGTAKVSKWLYWPFVDYSCKKAFVAGENVALA
jgi:hypothetical protein